MDLGPRTRHCYSSRQSITQIMLSQRRISDVPSCGPICQPKAPHRLPLPPAGNPTTNVASSMRIQPQSPPAQSSAGNTTRPTANASPPTVTPITARKRWCSSDRLNLAATFIGLGAGVYCFYVRYVLTDKNDVRETWRDCHDRAMDTHTIVFN